MKKLRKVVITFLFLVALLLSIQVQSEASSDDNLFLDDLHFDVQIHENGNMDVIETWNIDVKETNTLYKTFKTDRTKYSKITDVKVIDVTKGTNQPFRQINELMYHVTKNCYYGMKNDDGDFEIAWGVGLDHKHEMKTYQISYTVEGAIAKYSDYAELYWQFVGKDFSISADQVTGTITLPENGDQQEEIKVWGHTENLNGEIYASNLNTIEFEVNNFNSGRYIEIRTLFPTQMITSSTRGENRAILNQVVEEETKWANEANSRRARRDFLKTASAIVIVVLFVLIDIKLIKDMLKNIRKLKRIKKLKPTEDIIYYREMPRESSTPAEAVSLLKKAKSGLPSGDIGKIFSATLLDLNLKKIIDFQVDKDKKGKEIITIKLLDEVAVNHLEDKDEKAIADFLVKAFTSKNKQEITVKDLQRYIQTSSSKVVILQEKISKGCKEGLKKKNLIDKEQEEEYKKLAQVQAIYLVAFVFGIAFGIPLIALTSTYVTIGMIPFIILTLINTIIISISVSKITVFTQEGINETEKWKGLKKYMEEFSLLDKREVPEIAIWEKFLVYATAFGIADKVLKQLKMVYPDMENTIDINTYSCMYLMTHTDFSRSFSNSISTSMSSAYSSGTGGGGGFSGGGGGGRWPEVAEEADKPFYQIKYKKERKDGPG